MSDIQPDSLAGVPMKTVGPAKVFGPVVSGEVWFPLATYETPLWPSVQRGAVVSTHCDGIQVVLVDDRMTRSVLVEATDAVAAVDLVRQLHQRRDELAAEAEAGSRFTRFLDLHHQIVGNLVYLRLEMHTGDAAGHNMVTAAADRVLTWICQTFPGTRYVSISGNFCTDKKATAVNGILGRGKNVVTEMLVPKKLCTRFLKTTPEQVVELNIKKNLIGTMLAGGIRSANAHYANMLLAFYLATGQDAANIVEGSQGIVHAEVRDGDLYFSATLPNLIVGTIGAGKQLDFVRTNLTKLGCTEERDPGKNAQRLAGIAAACALCGELSLLAAQTNPGELMAAHTRLERS